jgi:hypothetical protein
MTSPFTRNMKSLTEKLPRKIKFKRQMNIHLKKARTNLENASQSASTSRQSSVGPSRKMRIQNSMIGKKRPLKAKHCYSTMMKRTLRINLSKML